MKVDAEKLNENEEILCSEEGLVVRRQDEIRVFRNTDNGISIVAYRWPEDDGIVAFGPNDAEAVIAAIRLAVLEIREG